MIEYNKISQHISEVTYDCELVGYVELIGDMYSIEIYYMTLNLPKDKKRLIKGIIERLVKWQKHRDYKEMVKRYELRNSKMYGKKYVEFHILD